MAPCHQHVLRLLAFASWEAPVGILRSLASLQPLGAGLRLSHPAGGEGGAAPQALAVWSSLSLREWQLYPTKGMEEEKQ